MSSLSPDLVALLACPKCKGALQERPDGFACAACQLLFPIEEGIPNFLLSDARPLDPASASAPPR